MSVNGRLVDSFSTSSKPQDAKDLATIDDLPTELLIRVFHAATEFRFSDLTLMEASTTLLSLSRVSHHWRAVLFSLPELWGRLIDVVGFSEAQVLHFIKHSGMSSIELFVDGGSISQLTNVKREDIQHSFSRVLLELGRISYLVIRRFHLSRHHYDRLQLPAPVLNLFSFEGHAPDPVRLPAKLFDNHAPRLRSVHLCSASIDFEHTTFPNLRELAIRDIRDPFIPPAITWLTFLSNHPTLTSLNLSYAIAIRFSDQYEWLPKIKLSLLQDLSLTDDATSCAHILPKIVVPSSCRVNIFAGLDNHNGMDTLQAVFSNFVSDRFCNELEIKFSGISIAFTNQVFDNALFQTSPFFFKFQWQAEFDSFDDLQLRHNVFDFVPSGVLPTVETLRIILSPINGRYPFDDASLLSLFKGWLGHLTSVQHLTLDSCTLETFLDVLCDGYYHYSSDSENGDREEYPPITLPSLQGLEVVRTKEEELDWDAFISFAEWRDEVHHSIRYITVPQGEVDHLNRNDGSLLADLEIEINLK